MENLTAKQAVELGKAFHSMGNLVQDYLFEHWKNMEPAQRKELESLVSRIFKLSDDLAVQSTLLVMEQAKSDLEKIKAISVNMKTSVKRLKSIQLGISLASGVVGLGAAILSKNPKEKSRHISDIAASFSV